MHGVQLSEIELSRLAAAGATLVTCPRSNRWTGVGDPPASRFYRSGVRVAVGTDSLASVDDLNVFSELAAIRRLAPDVPARALLDSATRAGAEALGFEDAFGTIEPGKLAELIAVRVPAGVADVEEYLVSGIQPSRHSLAPRARTREPVNRLKTYASFVRFSHSVFALPFALTGALLALHRLGEWSWRAIGWRLGWIVVAMVAARSAAMGFNRLADARHDALNPRTAMRELPRGAMTMREAAAFVDRLERGVRVRGVEAERPVLRAVAGRAGDRVLVLAGQALHVVHAAVPRDSPWRWRRSAAGSRPAGAAAPSRGCSGSRSAPGSAASTCSTPART